MTLRGSAFILPNMIARSSTSVTAASGATVPAGFEASYLQTEEPSDRARISGLDPLYTRWRADFNGLLRDVGGIGLVNSNLSPTGRYRVLSQSNTAPGIHTGTLAPNALAASTNVTGGVTDVDEPVSAPGSNYITPTTTTSNWTARFSFPTPAVPPRTGANMVQFGLFVALGGTPPSSPTQSYPGISLALYESAVLKAQLGWCAVTAAAGQVLIFPFNITQLADATGTNLEVLVSGFPGTSNYAKLGALAFYYEDSAEVFTYDSGWLSSPLEGYSDLDGPQPTRSLGVWPASTIDDAGGVEVQFMDDQTDHYTSGSPDAVQLPKVTQSISGYVELGVVAAGPGVFLSKGFRNGSGPAGRVLVEERGGNSEGGQTYAADSFRRRGESGELIGTRDEILTIKDRVAWRRGHSGAFFFAAEPDISQARQLFTSGWWTARCGDDRPEPSARYDSGDGTMFWSMSIELEEKL